MSCKCQECSKQYFIDLIVPDETWEKIKPSGKPQGAGLLCGSCIMTKIDKFGYGAYNLTKICGNW